jgi:hypothetical protein
MNEFDPSVPFPEAAKRHEIYVPHFQNLKLSTPMALMKVSLILQALSGIACQKQTADTVSILKFYLTPYLFRILFDFFCINIFCNLHLLGLCFD